MLSAVPSGRASSYSQQIACYPSVATELTPIGFSTAASPVHAVADLLTQVLSITARELASSEALRAAASHWRTRAHVGHHLRGTSGDVSLKTTWLS